MAEQIFSFEDLVERDWITIRGVRYDLIDWDDVGFSERKKIYQLARRVQSYTEAPTDSGLKPAETDLDNLLRKIVPDITDAVLATMKRGWKIQLMETFLEKVEAKRNLPTAVEAEPPPPVPTPVQEPAQGDLVATATASDSTGSI